MLNDSLPPNALSNQSWSPDEVIKQDADWLDRILGKWYRLTTPSQPAARAKYVERDRYQKARLTSTVALIYLLFLAAAFPAVLITPGPAIISYCASIVTCVISLIVNRAGKINLAGSLLVLVCEVCMAISIMSFSPFDTSNLPLYDLFVIQELLAASLLPVNSVFIVAFLNVTFIILDLLYQPHTQAMEVFLQKQLALAIVIPCSIQIVVAGVVTLWVYSSLRANVRANRAEMLAALEHTVALRLEAENKEKQELEESIQLLVQEHVKATNGHFVIRIAYPPAKVLWPLVGVINALGTRLQRSEQNNHELVHLRQSIVVSTEKLHLASSTPQKPLHLSQTGTDVDLLVLAAKALQEAALRSGHLSSSSD